MKLRAKETFKDRETGRMYAQGQIIDFPKKRAEELLENAPNLVENAVQTSQNRKVATKSTTKK